MNEVVKIGFVSLNHFPLLYVLGIWFRLCELGVFSVFFLSVLTATQLFEELENRLEELWTYDASNDDGLISLKLDDLRIHYDLVCRLVDQINDCFGIVLVYLILGIFYKTTNTLAEFMKNSWMGISFLNDIIFSHALRALFRFLLLLIVSHRLKYCVRLNNVTALITKHSSYKMMFLKLVVFQSSL